MIDREANFRTMRLQPTEQTRDIGDRLILVYASIAKTNGKEYLVAALAGNAGIDAVLSAINSAFRIEIQNKDLTKLSKFENAVELIARELRAKKVRVTTRPALFLP